MTLNQAFPFVHLHVLTCKIKGLVHKISNIFLVLIFVLAQLEHLDSDDVLDSGAGVGPGPGIVAPGAEGGKYPNPRAIHK